MIEPVLRCEGIEVRFGPVTAVAGFTFAFHAGRTYAVIGPNGAGKTTLMNALSGRVDVAAGRVVLDGEDITTLAAHRRARAGLGRSFQVTQVFPGFSVRDNLRIAALGHERDAGVFWTVLGRRRAVQERADQVLEDIGLAARAATPAESLSHGEQRALELGLALVADPRVLLLDEPLAGVGHHNLESAMEMLAKVTAGRTVILIEHNMDVVMGLSQEIVVMTQGKILASGTPDHVRGDPAVRAAYLGEGE